MVSNRTRVQNFYLCKLLTFVPGKSEVVNERIELKLKQGYNKTI